MICIVINAYCVVFYVCYLSCFDTFRVLNSWGFALGFITCLLQRFLFGLLTRLVCFLLLFVGFLMYFVIL